MLDGVSLDQLRTFIAAADEGSFSAAARRLRRAQSVVSQTLANLEGQLGGKLFDRRGHVPVLTDQGRALLADARTVAGRIDLLKARAKSLVGGLEPELSMAVDVMLPDAAFTAAVAAFQKKISGHPPQIGRRVECCDRARARRALLHRHGGILGASAAATHSRITADDKCAHSGRDTAPAGNSARADSDNSPRRTHSAYTRQSVRYFGSVRSPSQCPKSLAPFPAWRQTCVPARRLRVWRITAACDGGGSCERCAR